MTKKFGKIAGILFPTLLYTIFILCALGTIFAASLRNRPNDAIRVLGYEARYVLSGSMEKNPSTDVSAYKVKSIKKHSIVFIETPPRKAEKREKWYAALKVGDVMTFYYGYIGGEAITHRIVDIEEKQDRYILSLKGDNPPKNAESMKQVINASPKDGQNEIVGKVVGKSYLLGLLASTLARPIGIVFLLIAPCLIIVLYETARIISAVKEK